MKTNITAIGEGKQDWINSTRRHDVILERKIENITSGLQPEFSGLLYSISEDNALTLGNYIQALRAEVNPSDHYRRDVIKLLCTFSQYNNNHSFKAMSIVLESYRKPEASDPMHGWIGTYNIYRIHLIRFFRWLYYPDIEQRKRPKPEVIQNILQLKRKK